MNTVRFAQTFDPISVFCAFLVGAFACVLCSAGRNCGLWTGPSMIEALVQSVGHRIKYAGKVRSTLYYGGSSIVCQGLRFLGILISTASIAPDEFGKFATAVMLIGLCGLAAAFGQNSTFLSYTRSDPAYARFHFLMSLTLSFLVVLLVVVSILVLPGLSDLRPAIPLLALIVLIEGAYVTPMMIVQKRFEFGKMAIIEIAANATWLLCFGLGSRLYPVTMTLIFARMMESLVRGSSLLGWLYRDLIQGESLGTSDTIMDGSHVY